MAVVERRSKSITFRLSEQEYEALMKIGETQGARCVSEAARSVIHGLLAVHGGGKRVKSKSDARVENMLVQLGGRLDELHRELKCLSTAVGRLLQAHLAEAPEPSTTVTSDVLDRGLVQLTDAINHVPDARRTRTP